MYNNYADWVSPSVYCYLVCTTIMPTGLVHQFTIISVYNNYAYLVSQSVYCYIAGTTIMPTGLANQFTVILCVQQLCLLG